MNGGILHGQAAAQVAVDPFHHRVFVGVGTFGDEVVDVVRPILDRRVTASSAFLDDDLDDRRVQAFRRVDRRGAAFDVVDLGAFLDDDQGALELAHVFGVDAEIGLQGDVDLDAGGYVEERAARPDRRVERGEFIVLDRDDRGEVFADQVGMFADRGVGIDEDDAFLLKVVAEAVVDDFRLVLRRRRRGTFVRLRECRVVRKCS